MGNLMFGTLGCYRPIDLYAHSFKNINMGNMQYVILAGGVDMCYRF